MEDLSLHILDLVQNSKAAEAKNIDISLAQKGDFLNISVSDDGKGMEEEMLKKVESPFITSRTTRKVGLGISLFKAAAKRTGGYFKINSKKNKGTDITGAFKIDSIDRQPVGDLAETIKILISSDTKINYVVSFISDNDNYEFNTKEIKQILGEVKITEPEVNKWITENIESGIKTVFGGILNEVNKRIGSN